MTQFQPQVPDPLSHDLPALLTPGGMAAPTIGVLLSIFVREGIDLRCPDADRVSRHQRQ